MRPSLLRRLLCRLGRHASFTFYEVLSEAPGAVELRAYDGCRFCDVVRRRGADERSFIVRANSAAELPPPWRHQRRTGE